MDTIRPTPTVGVICEFNPFHGGHAYLLSEARRAIGPNGCVICLMSGLTVQRGELAVADPYLRARAALAGGADLVLELPFPWSSGSAPYFAAAGVDALARLGVDHLVFGSESGDEASLTAASAWMDHPAFGDVYAEYCRSGIGSAAAFAKALRQISDAQVRFPDEGPSANDILGINYLSAIRARAYAMRPLVIRRMGSGYRDDVIRAGEYPSATALRTILYEAVSDPVVLADILDGTMPPEALRLLMEGIRQEECPTDPDRIPSLCHALFRLSDASRWEGIAEMNGGVAGHMIRVAKTAATPAEFMEGIRTKQYTDARLRRAMLFALTGVTVEDLRARPAYTQLLAANRRGCEFLRDHRRAGEQDVPALPVVTKPADAPIGRQRVLAERADALFTLAYPIPKPAGERMRRSPWVEK